MKSELVDPNSCKLCGRTPFSYLPRRGLCSNCNKFKYLADILVANTSIYVYACEEYGGRVNDMGRSCKLCGTPSEWSYLLNSGICLHCNEFKYLPDILLYRDGTYRYHCYQHIYRINEDV